MPPVVTALAAVGALALVLASVLVVADRKLRVDEDPRIDRVEDMLPRANCGACGYPGCRPFAEALVAGQTQAAECTVSTDDGRAAIARFLGVAVGTAQKRVARLACAGGDNVARRRARYRGLRSCAAANRTAGGGKSCAWGCLGLGDCASACAFDAIHMDAHGLPIVDVERCTACGDCVLACPKDLFSLQSIELELWVACRSQLEGDAVLDDCEVACTACGRCAADAPGVVEMRDGLPVVCAARVDDTSRRAIERCPTGAIVWLEGGRIGKGRAARQVIRQQPRPDAPT